jgi:hypothetical protein
MDTEEIIKSTLNFIGEFRIQFEELPGAQVFLDDYSTDLRQALAQAETLTPADQQRILERASEVLKIISAEWEKLEPVLGNHLRLAIVQKLRADIRVAIRDLEKETISA